MLFVGAVLIVSGVPKVLAPRQTARDVQLYRILPTSLARAFGYGLGPIELVCGLALLAGYWAQWVALAVTILLTMFMITVGVAMLRKQNLTCSCFGLLYRERVGWKTQIRDSVLLLMSLTVFIWPSSATLADRATNTSTLDLLGVAASAFVLATALGLGWIAVKGWPQWFVRLIRRRNATNSLAAIR